jgi:hypothetical protein
VHFPYVWLRAVRLHSQNSKDKVVGLASSRLYLTHSFEREATELAEVCGGLDRLAF